MSIGIAYGGMTRNGGEKKKVGWYGGTPIEKHQGAESGNRER